MCSIDTAYDQWMNKELILKHLKLAQPDHMDWIKQGHNLLNGTAQEDLRKPISCTDCGFGKWYFSEGHKLVSVPQLKELENLHKEVHTLYTEMYYITFDRRKIARSTIISGGVEIPVEELAFRTKKIKVLEKKAVTMIRKLAAIEKEVAEIEEGAFESVWFQ